MGQFVFTTGQTGVDAAAHHARHEDSGADEISVTGLSGLLADDQHVLDSEVVSAAEPYSIKWALILGG